MVLEYIEEGDDSANVGYDFSQFPAGALSAGGNGQQFVVPYDVPAIDTQMVGLTDQFSGGNQFIRAQPVSDQGTLTQSVMNQFTAGASTLNSLSDAADPFSADRNGRNNGEMGTTGAFGDQFGQQGVNPGDVPLMPYSATYFNFGNGSVDYGLANQTEPSAAAIIASFAATLPDGGLAGIKSDLTPTFSSINQVALEERPMLQTRGKMGNWYGITAHLPDDLRIDPREALLGGGGDIPANIPETTGELQAALTMIKGANGNVGTMWSKNTNMMVQAPTDPSPAWFAAPMAVGEEY